MDASTTRPVHRLGYGEPTAHIRSDLEVKTLVGGDSNRKHQTWQMITFRRADGTVGGDLTHAAAVAAQRHEAGDDGRLAVADAAHQHGALALAAFRGLQRFLQLLEQPVAADKHGVCSDAGHLEEQRLQHDVHRFVGSETSWREVK